MPPRLLDEPTLRAQFDLIEIDDEGILLNRQSGTVYRVNRTGYEIWAALLDGASVAAIVDKIVDRFAVERQQAERDVAATLQVQASVPLNTNPGQFRWSRTADGYTWFEGEVSLCDVSESGESLRLRPHLGLTEQQIWFRLKAVVPKVLALRGIPVLHASAVELGGGLLVFTGPSGAGKTTSARAFADVGGLLVSEDLLMVDATSPAPAAPVGGEATVRKWVAEWASVLATDRQQTVDCTQLDHCLLGDRRPIRKILFVDAERRFGQRIEFHKLSRTEGFVALLDSLFFACVTPNDWRAQLGILRDIVQSVPTARVNMPMGLDNLAEAAKNLAYSAITAS